MLAALRRALPGDVQRTTGSSFCGCLGCIGAPPGQGSDPCNLCNLWINNSDLSRSRNSRDRPWSPAGSPGTAGSPQVRLCDPQITQIVLQCLQHSAERCRATYNEQPVLLFVGAWAASERHPVREAIRVICVICGSTIRICPDHGTRGTGRGALRAALVQGGHRRSVYVIRRLRRLRRFCSNACSTPQSVAGRRTTNNRFFFLWVPGLHRSAARSLNQSS